MTFLLYLFALRGFIPGLQTDNLAVSCSLHSFASLHTLTSYHHGKSSLLTETNSHTVSKLPILMCNQLGMK